MVTGVWHGNNGISGSWAFSLHEWDRADGVCLIKWAWFAYTYSFFLTSNQIHIYKVWFHMSRLLWLVSQALQGGDREAQSQPVNKSVWRFYSSPAKGGSRAIYDFINTHTHTHKSFDEAQHAFRHTQLLALFHRICSYKVESKIFTSILTIDSLSECWRKTAKLP